LKATLYILLIIFLAAGLYPSNVLSQAENQQTAPNSVRDPAKIKFNYRMEQSSKQMHWSRIYYQSFKKTEEVSYLELAARYCLSAIQSLHETQNLLSKTTRFHYQTKKKKMAACKFYNSLQLASHHLAVEHHLKPADQNICGLW